MEVSLRACLRNSKGPCLPVRSLSHTFVVGQCPGTSVLAEKDRAAFRELLRVSPIQTLLLCPGCLLQSS